MHPDVPIYLAIAFLIAILFPIVMIAQLGKRHAGAEKAQTVFWGVIRFF
ncbi:MAG: hypothetical protein AAF570_03735 [Bacteroidota bacterium]